MRHKDMAKVFATVLRKQRARKKITQESLAEKADIASKMVSLIERNQRNPSLNVADSIAQGLGISLAQMIKEAETLRKKRHRP
jgi:transcriptional regulator with XRE-family HTH domain